MSNQTPKVTVAQCSSCGRVMAIIRQPTPFVLGQDMYQPWGGPPGRRFVPSYESQPATMGQLLSNAYQQRWYLERDARYLRAHPPASCLRYQPSH